MLQQANTEYRVTSVKSGEEGLALAATEEFDLYVLDYRYPGMTGVDICHKIRERSENAEREEAMKCGADAYLIKPDDLSKLTDTARQLLSRGRASLAA